MLLKNVFSLFCEELLLIWQSLEITERRHNLQHCLAHTLFPLTKIDKPNKKYDLESPRS